MRLTSSKAHLSMPGMVPANFRTSGSFRLGVMGTLLITDFRREFLLDGSSMILDTEVSSCYPFITSSTIAELPMNKGQRWCSSVGFRSKMRLLPSVALPPACSINIARGLAS